MKSHWSLFSKDMICFSIGKLEEDQVEKHELHFGLLNLKCLWDTQVNMSVSSLLCEKRRKFVGFYKEKVIEIMGKVKETWKRGEREEWPTPTLQSAMTGEQLKQKTCNKYTSNPISGQTSTYFLYKTRSGIIKLKSI